MRYRILGPLEVNDEQATLEHPLRESLWAWRMRALHAEGRDAEAPEEIPGTLVATCG